jgi:hypothetical protein
MERRIVYVATVTDEQDTVAAIFIWRPCMDRKIITTPPPEFFNRNAMRPIDWAMHGLGCTACLVLGILIGRYVFPYVTLETMIDTYSEDFIPEEPI